MDFKNKDKVEVSIYLSQVGIPDDICETFESKQLKTLELLLCFSWFIFFCIKFYFACLAAECIHILYSFVVANSSNRKFPCNCAQGTVHNF